MARSGQAETQAAAAAELAKKGSSANRKSPRRRQRSQSLQLPSSGPRGASCVGRAGVIAREINMRQGTAAGRPARSLAAAAAQGRAAASSPCPTCTVFGPAMSPLASRKKRMAREPKSMQVTTVVLNVHSQMQTVCEQAGREVKLELCAAGGSATGTRPGPAWRRTGHKETGCARRV